MSAQEDTGNETFLSTTSTTTTSAAMVTALGVLTVVTITPKPSDRALRIYLEQNAVAVQDGVTTGGGQAVRDLSRAFGIATATEQSAFGDVLRTHRVTLTALLADHRVTQDEVGQFILTIYNEMLLHDELSAATQRMQG